MTNTTPAPYFVSVAILSAIVLLSAVFMSINQPYSGLSLGVDAQKSAVVIVAAQGPASELKIGDSLDLVSGVGQASAPITPQTLLEEPDTLGSIAAMWAFFAEQGRIHAIFESDTVTLSGTTADNREWAQDITPESRRPIWNLTIPFWLQVFSGMAATLIAGWVWSLNPSRWPQCGLMLSGFGLQLSATAAAVYSSRALGLPETAFWLLSLFNNVGTALFGLGLIIVFLTYPKKIVSRWVPWGILGVAAIWYTQLFAGVTQSTELGFYLPIMVMLIAILGLIGVQAYICRKDPISLAALRMLGLGVIMGAGTFVVTRVLPLLFGLPVVTSQAILFPLISLVFAGVALAVVKYRLFDMPRWSSLLLFYFVGAALLAALDAALITVFALDRVPALGLSLLVIGLVYLPLRDRLTRLLLNRRDKSGTGKSVLAAAEFVTRAPSHEVAQLRWSQVLKDLFDPLEMEMPDGLQAVETVH